MSTRMAISGGALTADDAGYEQARSVFNAMVTTRPRLIAQCQSVADVKSALWYAQDHRIPVSVRSGGHSVGGNSLVDDGMVIDVRGLDGVEVNPAGRTIRVGGGVTWGQFDAAAQQHGLATTGGRVSTTGVSGLTLGGGSGWLERKLGLACDNLLSVDLVTADGREVTASETANPELFWALHGGGGNFGVVTALTFRLHRLPEFSIALMVWPAAEGRAVAAAYRELLHGAPDEIGGALLYLTAPDEDFVPDWLVGSACCAVLVTLTGGVDELGEIVAPLLAGPPAGQLIAEVPYAGLQQMLDDPPGYRNYWTAEHLRELPDAALDAFAAGSGRMPAGTPSQQILLPLGGAVTRSRDWPGFGREAPWVVHPFGLWTSPADDEQARAWCHGLRADLRAWAADGVYLNFIGDEGQDRVIAGYGGISTYRRLARVKAEYDPGSVFNRWHPIVPSAG